MHSTTTKPARTWDWPRTHRDHALSNDAEGSSQRRFCADCIIATPGYDFREGQPDLLSFVSAPVRRKQATRDLTLKIISHPAAPRGDVVCNVAFSLPPTRFTHSFKKGAKDH